MLNPNLCHKIQMIVIATYALLEEMVSIICIDFEVTLYSTMKWLKWLALIDAFVPLISNLVISMYVLSNEFILIIKYKEFIMIGYYKNLVSDIDWCA
jgi:hypothetical protein